MRKFLIAIFTLFFLVGFSQENYKQGNFKSSTVRMNKAQIGNDWKLQKNNADGSLQITNRGTSVWTMSSVGYVTTDDTSFVKTTGADNIYDVKTFYSAPMTAAGTNGNNIRLGTSALNAVTSGYGNVAISPSALKANTTGYSNIAIGDSALRQHTLGYGNIGIGSRALAGAITTGAYNVAVGHQAGLSVQGVGSNNVLVGPFSGDAITTGDGNVFMGYNSGTGTTVANNNVGIGKDVLKYNVTGASNVAIGNGAGTYETSSNKLIIHNTNGGADTAIIYGDMSAVAGTRVLQVNAPLQVMRGDTAGAGSTAMIGCIIYNVADGVFYGLIAGAPPTWTALH